MQRVGGCCNEWMWVKYRNACRNILPIQGGDGFCGPETHPSYGKKALHLLSMIWDRRTYLEIPRKMFCRRIHIVIVAVI